MSDTISFASFNNQATEYDPNNALVLAQLCAKAYQHEYPPEKGEKRRKKRETNDQWRERIKLEAVDWGFAKDRVYCFDNKGSQAILLADAEKIIVAFRGSEERTDWNINFNRLRNKNYQGRYNVCIHSGFAAYVIYIWEPYNDPQGRPEAKGIKAIIEEEMKDSRKSLWFTGHSLGAAAATLAASTCAFAEPPIEVSGVYTYGQPRVGDSKFAELYNSRLKSKTFRFVNNNDAVTKIPSWAPFFFFAHVGQIKYLTEDGELVDYEKLTWTQRLTDTFKGIVEDISESGLDSINDHSMDTGYIPPLRRYLSELDIAKK